MGINPALKRGWETRWEPQVVSSQLSPRPFPAISCGFSLQLCAGRGKALLDDGESSLGEGKALCDFFHIKCDICFGMTQAGSHHPRRRTEEGKRPYGLGRIYRARSFPRARQGGTWEVIISLNPPVHDTLNLELELLCSVWVALSVLAREVLDAKGSGFGARHHHGSCHPRVPSRSPWPFCSVPIPGNGVFVLLFAVVC